MIIFGIVNWKVLIHIITLEKLRKKDCSYQNWWWSFTNLVTLSALGPDFPCIESLYKVLFYRYLMKVNRWDKFSSCLINLLLSLGPFYRMFPGLSAFYVLWFAFNIIHKIGRAEKNVEDLGTFITWCRREVGKEWGGGAVFDKNMCNKPECEFAYMQVEHLWSCERLTSGALVRDRVLDDEV